MANNWNLGKTNETLLSRKKNSVKLLIDWNVIYEKCYSQIVYINRKKIKAGHPTVGAACWLRCRNIFNEIVTFSPVVL